MNRITLIMGSIFILTISVVLLIHVLNDHKECGTIAKSRLDINGNTVKIEQHACKENYSF